MGGQDFLADGLLGQRQPELAGLKGHILIVVLGPLQHVLGGAGGRLRPHAAREAPPPPPALQHALGPALAMHTWIMLCIWGMSLSIRTSNSITRARHTFLRTSGSSSTARANRCYREDVVS